MNDPEVLNKMYHAVYSGADRALTLLDEGKVQDAKWVLTVVLQYAEELYLSDGPEETED